MAGVGLAAGIATAATLATTAATVGTTIAGATSGGGGGSGGPTQFQKVPQDPLTVAQRGYWNRVAVENANKTYPSFAAYSQSGGDPNLAKFPLTMPGLTPQEMTAFGFTGPQGQRIPTTPQAQAGGAAATGLSPTQEIYLSQQRNRQAKQAGGSGTDTPLQRLGAVSNRLTNVQGNLAGMGTAEVDPATQLGRRQDRLENRVTNLQNRQQALLTKVGQTP
jgi:hypothetical protein